MTARQLLRFVTPLRVCLHVFSTDDTDVVARGQVIRGGVWEPIVQVRRHATISNEFFDPFPKVPICEVQISHQVHRHPLVRENDQKEHKVHKQLQKIRHEFQVKDTRPFPLPLTLQHAISVDDEVLGEAYEELCGENHVLKSKQQQNARTLFDRGRDDVIQHAQVQHQERPKNEGRSSK